MRAVALAVVVALAFGGCKTPKSGAGETIDTKDANDRPVPSSALGPGDMLEVRVFQETELSGVWRVSSEGMIDFPLCGRVMMQGKTSSQAADALTACLQNGYLKHPSVSVLIREYNSKKVFIFGEVSKPGTFPYEDNMTIIQAVLLAGGFTKSASKNNTNITRILDGQEKKVKVAVQDIAEGREKNFVLQPGDIIFVPESLF